MSFLVKLRYEEEFYHHDQSNLDLHHFPRDSLWNPNFPSRHLSANVLRYVAPWTLPQRFAKSSQHGYETPSSLQSMVCYQNCLIKMGFHFIQNFHYLIHNNPKGNGKNTKFTPSLKVFIKIHVPSTLISTPCRNKKLTISTWPLVEAKCWLMAWKTLRNQKTLDWNSFQSHINITTV